MHRGRDEKCRISFFSSYDCKYWLTCVFGNRGKVDWVVINSRAIRWIGTHIANKIKQSVFNFWSVCNDGVDDGELTKSLVIIPFLFKLPFIYCKLSSLYFIPFRSVWSYPSYQRRTNIYYNRCLQGNKEIKRYKLITFSQG